MEVSSRRANCSVLLCDTAHQVSQGESAGWPRSLPHTMTQRKSRGPYRVTTQFYFFPWCQNCKCNQYLPGNLASIIVSNSGFQTLVMFWMWRHHGIALWCHGDGAWHNALFLTTASNINCWTDVANRVAWLWWVGESYEPYGPYRGLELPNHGIKPLPQCPRSNPKKCK